MKLTKSEKKTKKGGLKRRHMRIRQRLAGTAERPRLLVRKSLKHVYASVIDDSCETGSKTILALSTNCKGADKNKGFCNIPSAKKLGGEVANALKEKGYKTVVFDRGGYAYHGVVKALCEAAREGGITI